MQSNRARQKSMAYLGAYQKHLEKFKNKSPLMFEIGCGYPQSDQPEGALGMGGSLSMFQQWLGHGTKIIGIDILPSCREFQDPDNNIFIEIGSQSDSEFMTGLVDKYGEPDIILDDGSHVEKDLIDSFNTLYPHLKTNGVYIVEDCGGNHISSGLPFDDSERFLGFAMKHVLAMNQFYAKNRLARAKNIEQENFRASNIGFMLSNISFYPDLVIFEKGLNVPIDQMVAPAHYFF